MFPIAREDDPLFENVRIYIKDEKGFIETDKVCICPKEEIQSKGFKGFVQSNKHPNAMKILLYKNKNYEITKFFCIKCLQVRSSLGGNLSRHYQFRCVNSTPHATKQNIYSILLFCINHYVPLTSLGNEDGKLAFPNYPSYPSILSIIFDLKNKIQNDIKKEIEKISKITIECDGWTHPKGIRFLGIVLRYPLDDCIIEAPVDLLETPDFTLGSEEMAQMIEKTMNDLNIARNKWLSLSSDGANDMSKLAKELQLEWDRCILHLLHLKIQKFWKSSLERLHKVHQILTKLHMKTNWNEFMYHHGNEFPEIGKKRNFTIGTDIRWGSHLDECKQMIMFRKPILTFQRMKWEKKHKNKYVPNPDKNILESDFEMVDEILPLFETISNSLKLLESRELYLSKMAITICYIHDEIYKYITKNEIGNWHENCSTLIDSINDDIFYSNSAFAKNLLASVILDPKITTIPTQIQCQIDTIVDYIKEKVGNSQRSIYSPPIQKVDKTDLDPVEQKFCKPVSSEYDDEVNHWLEKTRPNGNDYNNPFEYWKKHSGHPNLKKYAMQLFVHASTSIACERFFSICSNVANDKRSSMTADNFSSLCIVKANIDRARKIIFEENNI